MKLLVALAILMVVGPLKALDHPIFDHLSNECAKKGGITPYLIENHPANIRVKCYYACQLEKLEIIANGVVNPFDLSVLNVTQENYDKFGILIKPCLTITNPNRCELGYLVFDCLKVHFKNVEVSK
ncbi:uncharacterized protein LOC108106553 [Drosophila eugracilis]|uniref:uncharacterized protein LOC108106553 n=1 Tax=Drosophila eugracilis TaxID=29029 RepID=UPI0007E5E948|nr:uncharacterized protein LOC108106553 [Drosophila eugracilis]